jgi:hypothetical protein
MEYKKSKQTIVEAKAIPPIVNNNVPKPGIKFNKSKGTPIKICNPNFFNSYIVIFLF